MKAGALAATTVTATSLNGQGSPNLLRNGDFEVVQRGTTFAAASGYTLDGYSWLASSDAVVTVTQDTDVPTFSQAGHLSKHSLKIQVTTADASIATGQYAFLMQIVEGYDFYPCVGKNVTLSFWVKAKKTGIYTIGFANSVFDRSHVKEYTVNVADTWEKKTVTLVMDYSGGTWDYANGKGLHVVFPLACGATYQTTKDAWQSGNYFSTSSQVNALDNTANYINLAQVKLEIGSVATPFVPEPASVSLQRNRRHYREIPFYARYCSIAMGRVALNNSANFSFRFDQPMRAAPTGIGFKGTTTSLTINDSTALSTSVVFNSAVMSPDGGMVYVTCGGTSLTPGRVCELYDDTAAPNSSIYFSSEL